MYVSSDSISTSPNRVFRMGAPPQNVNTTVKLTSKNAAALVGYAALTGHTPAEFLNRYLEDYMLALFEEPMGGDLMGHLVNFKYHISADAERVTAWSGNVVSATSLKQKSKSDSQ
jgi:hypothetical protein